MTSLADSGKVLWKASILLLAGLVVGNIQMVLIWPPSEISSQTVIARWLLAAKSPAFAMRWQQLSTLTAVRKPCLAPGVPRRGRLFFLPPCTAPRSSPHHPSLPPTPFLQEVISPLQRPMGPNAGRKMWHLHHPQVPPAKQSCEWLMQAQVKGKPSG